MIEFIKALRPDLVLGIVLIVINFPLGWVGLVWFIHLAKNTGKKIFYIIGVSLYIASWLALFAGIFLCGKEYAQDLFHKYHTPIIAVTVAVIISIIIVNRYFAKRDSKINKKHA